MFSETLKYTEIEIIERKWHKLLACEVLLGHFKEHTLNYFSEAFRVSFWTK